MSQIMSLESLIKEWQIDCKIDTTEPGRELLKIPNIHGKYNEQFSRHSLALKAQRLAYATTKRFRADYYAGRLTQQELEKAGLMPFQFVLKQDMATYMEADPQLQVIEQKIAIHEEAVTFLGNCLKELNNRGYNLRGYIDYLKFTSGGGGV